MDSPQQSIDLVARLERMAAQCERAKRDLSDREAYRRIEAAATAVAAALRIVQRASGKPGARNAAN